MSKLSKEKFNEEADRIVFQLNGFQFTRTHIYIILSVIIIAGCLKLSGVI